MHEIGCAFGKDHGSIQFLLSQHGGIAPVIRHRSQGALTLAERGDISRGIASRSSIREIARGLQRAAFTVSREVVRNLHVYTAIVLALLMLLCAGVRSDVVLGRDSRRMAYLPRRTLWVWERPEDLRSASTTAIAYLDRPRARSIPEILSSMGTNGSDKGSAQLCSLRPAVPVSLRRRFSATSLSINSSLSTALESIHITRLWTSCCKLIFLMEEIQHASRVSALDHSKFVIPG